MAFNLRWRVPFWVTFMVCSACVGRRDKCLNIVKLYKTKMDRNNSNNYRRISLLNIVAHSCMLLRHGPATDRHVFSRLHWPRGWSTHSNWMVRSLIKDLFGTSTMWFCHHACAPEVVVLTGMSRASSGRLVHVGRLDFRRGRGGGGQYRWADGVQACLVPWESF